MLKNIILKNNTYIIISLIFIVSQNKICLRDKKKRNDPVNVKSVYYRASVCNLGSPIPNDLQSRRAILCPSPVKFQLKSRNTEVHASQPEFYIHKNWRTRLLTVLTRSKKKPMMCLLLPHQEIHLLSLFKSSIAKNLFCPCLNPSFSVVIKNNTWKHFPKILNLPVVIVQSFRHFFASVLLSSTVYFHSGLCLRRPIKLKTKIFGVRLNFKIIF